MRAARDPVPVAPSGGDQVLVLAIQHGLVTGACVATVRAEPAPPGGPSVIERLIARGLLDEHRLADLLAEEAGCRRAEALVPEPAALTALPLEIARRLRALPLHETGARLVVAVADPLDLEAVDRLRHTLARPVELVVAPWTELNRALSAEARGTATALPGDRTRDGRDEPAVEWVDALLAEGLRRRASDIHVEPVAAGVRVRYRVDGALQPGRPVPPGLEAAVISRLKLIAQLSLAERRVPQDGRMRVELRDGPVDLRVASLPTVRGESLVLRILAAERLQPQLAELGLDHDAGEQLRALLGLPHGLVLVTGPTGSGKTTTLYSCLQYLSRADRKIITVEDPIEIQLPGINQVAVRPDCGLTFAAALRAILRQSPNVVMVGEIRDAGTAEVALNAALTGHLVFSTLHTNDAPGAITRLLDLGMKPFLVAAALRAVVAQRLVRRVCPTCAQPQPAPAGEALPELPAEVLSCASFRRGAGCPGCYGSGYRGRVGLFEFLRLDEALQELVYDRAAGDRLRAAARAGGWRTLREDGLRKAAAGLTTLDDVFSHTVGATG